MDISYVVISGDPVDETQTRVVVETQLPVVVNGYGGGRLTFVAPNATLQEVIEKKILWKFGEEAPAYQSEHRLIGNLTRIQPIIEQEEARREAERARSEAELRARVEADARATTAARAPKAVETVVESVTERDAPPVMKER